MPVVVSGLRISMLEMLVLDRVVPSYTYDSNKSLESRLGSYSCTLLLFMN